MQAPAVLQIFTGAGSNSLIFTQGLRSRGLTVKALDTRADPPDDLCSQEVFSALLGDLEQRAYSGVVLLPPNLSFGGHDQAGRLRGLTGKDRWGLTGLTSGEKELVRKETLLALRLCAVLRTCVASEIPFVLLVGDVSQQGPNILALDEFISFTRSTLDAGTHTICCRCSFYS